MAAAFQRSNASVLRVEINLVKVCSGLWLAADVQFPSSCPVTPKTRGQAVRAFWVCAMGRPRIRWQRACLIRTHRAPAISEAIRATAAKENAGPNDGFVRARKIRSGSGPKRPTTSSRRCRGARPCCGKSSRPRTDRLREATRADAARAAAQ